MDAGGGVGHERTLRIALQHAFVGVDGRFQSSRVEECIADPVLRLGGQWIVRGQFEQPSVGRNGLIVFLVQEMDVADLVKRLLAPGAFGVFVQQSVEGAQASS